MESDAEIKPVLNELAHSQKERAKSGRLVFALSCSFSVPKKESDEKANFAFQLPPLHPARRLLTLRLGVTTAEREAAVLLRANMVFRSEAKVEKREKPERGKGNRTKRGE